MNMSKTMKILIIVILICIIVPFAYILVPSIRPWLGGTFGSITPMIVNTFNYFSILFRTLPYGLLILLVIGIFSGIMVDRYAHSIYYGLRRRMVVTTYQDTGLFQSNVGLSQGQVAPQTTTPTVTTVPTVPVTLPLEDDK